MAGVYRPRNPKRTVLYRVIFHYFDRFQAEYENRLEKEYGFLLPVIKEVVERYLDCGNPRCGFARIRCPRCRAEHLLMFSCKTRGFCPSCHAKRLEEWGEWIREMLLPDVPHRRLDDSHLAGIFAQEIPRLLVGKGLLRPEWAKMIRKVYDVNPLLCPAFFSVISCS